MGIRIHSNIASIRAQNNLEKTGKQLNQALTRLSTGLRINSGQDDVAGLTTSEGLRAKIRGAEVARANIASANSVMSTAEGFLAQLTEISQEIRDIALQASDESLSTATRDALENNLAGMLGEYNRVVETANFNGVRLLDGSFVGRSIQAGTDEGETFDISIGDARAASIGEIAIYTSATRTVSSTAATTTALAFTTITNINIAGVQISPNAFTADGVSYADSDQSAIAYVRAINGYTAQTGVTARVQANILTFDYAAGDSLGSGHNLVINGITVKSDTNEYTINDSDDVAALVSLINSQSSLTGVVAQQVTSSTDITLTASDGRNIDIAVTGGTGASTDAFNFVQGGAGAGTVTAAVYRGTFVLTSSNSFDITGASAEFAGATGTVTAGIATGTSLDNVSVSTAASAGTAISILDKVIEQLQTRRALVGNAVTRLDSADAEIAARLENYSSAESRIRDADIAAETAKYTLATVLQQMGATVLAQANSQPQIALLLLQDL